MTLRTGAALIELIVFVLVTLGAIALSRGSLRNPTKHGFYRFYAFESILLLVLIEAPRWFTDPSSAQQIVSWLLLAGSIALAGSGFYLLRRHGRPGGGIETTTRLARTGVYGFIRHPLYTSLLLFAWGTFFKSPSLTGGLLGALASAFLFATAKVEEVECLQKFGPEYAEYMHATRMFIPFVF